ncbi:MULTISPECIES: diiron oxygenase [unclassified Micromonospora]|uniref:diiron oxygenase n=1 Tax=unclassified Micromonospora TaxID=2617518 RepID=UPI003A88EC35
MEAFAATGPGQVSHTPYADVALADLLRIRYNRIGAACEAVDAYDTRFGRWNERASVRRKAQPSLEGDGELYFPPELVPMLSHPLVTALGPAAIERLLVRRLYDYLSFTVELEELAVMPVAMRISRGRSGLDLPGPMRADAFKIVTDEAWHAQVSFGLVKEVEQLTSVPYESVRLPAFIDRLDAIQRRLPTELRGAEGLLFTVVSETLISRLLSDLPQDHRLPTAVRVFVRDHAEDEGRHHAYFRSLLQHVWPSSGPSAQRQIGPWIPELIFAFLEPDYELMGRGLHHEGLSAAEVEQVLVESWPRTRVISDVAEAAGAAVRYFQDVGAMDDARTHEAFVAAGLIAPCELA